jgi:hypothetical protein
VRWVFDHINAGISYNSVLTFDRGNVGISNTEPSAKLEISGASGNVLRVGVANNSTANIDLAGHVQLKAYGTGNLAYLQARDDNDDRAIGLQFRTQRAKGDLTEAMTINPDGSLELLQKPIEIIKYSNLRDQGVRNSSADYVEYQTAYKVNEWFCSIAGFRSGKGDIQEDDAGEIIRVVTYPNYTKGFWCIQAGFRTHNVEEQWDIWLMAIRSGIARAANNL